ncbi:hypothetical protein EV281_10475 [Rhizobium sp. BK418]|nr:hypothetical protein EV281_10475 [Rhizobium sp. BK418]
MVFGGQLKLHGKPALRRNVGHLGTETAVRIVKACRHSSASKTRRGGPYDRNRSNAIILTRAASFRVGLLASAGALLTGSFLPSHLTSWLCPPATRPRSWARPREVVAIPPVDNIQQKWTSIGEVPAERGRQALLADAAAVLIHGGLRPAATQAKDAVSEAALALRRQDFDIVRDDYFG